MSYLERNSRLLAEMQANANLKMGDERGKSSRIKFHSAGSYQSGELGQEVFAGIKVPEGTLFDHNQLKDRFIFELAVMTVVAQNMPHLLPSFITAFLWFDHR